uniref:NADH-ubiquinone oxidoreductase chain 3 n=1 Tax=Oncicola luehei TaxID=1100885 RepID=H2E2D7_9BILA|nr:NADH dehydrogenase subunit 3 [Oncicola luehei]AER42897.1 NADH dehydrogenase subunit 3 [Oncicola luehei]
MLLTVVCFIGGAMVMGSLVIMLRLSLKGGYVKAFECGFTKMQTTGGKISVRFYHMLVVFLLMDVEVVFLFFCPHIKFMTGAGAYYAVLVLVVVYLVGLVYELWVGGLSWSE